MSTFVETQKVAGPGLPVTKKGGTKQAHRRRRTAGTGLELLDVVVRNPQIVGRSLAEVSAEPPAGVRILAVRQGNQNRVPAPDIVLPHNDVVALAGESEEALESARQSIGEAAQVPVTPQGGRAQGWGV